MLQLVIDSNGKVPIPPEVMRKFGLAPDSKANFEDTPDKMIIEPIEKPPQKRRSISDMAGFLGPNSKALDILMEE
ncbi:MAG TPA: AbrB/MazE/SpoVT family DNA-binding domain-containing protein [Candidatus Kapabacteria bacterium]|nr:AbrB/MazE/SpoVT family DNA-binding domain-containing protein [Candidatus Kapabacteria bacterium]